MSAHSSLIELLISSYSAQPLGVLKYFGLQVFIDLPVTSSHPGNMNKDIGA